MHVQILGLLVAILLAFTPLFVQVLKNKRSGNAKYQKIMADFAQRVKRELYPGEVVEAVCGYIPCAAVTNKRLLIGSRGGIETVEFYEIQWLKGINGSGNKTTDPSQMLGLIIKARKRYTLGNHSEGFGQVVTHLYAHTEY